MMIRDAKINSQLGKSIAMEKIIILVLLSFASIVGLFVFSPLPTLWLLQQTLFSVPKDDRPKQYLDQQVMVFKDIVYPSKLPNNSFDFYKTNPSVDKKALVIWVHGGGFVGGDKLEVKNYVTRLASQGYAVIVLNYQLVPAAKYPEPVMQVAEAVTYIKKNFAAKNHLNMSNIFLAGDSAGAQIALQFLLTQSNPEYSALLKIPNLIDMSDIRGALLYCGPYDLKNMVLQANSIISRFAFHRIGWAYLKDKDWLSNNENRGLIVSEYLNTRLPPIYLTDGNTASFEQQARLLHKQLTQVGIPTSTRFFDQASYPTAHEYQFELETEAAKLALQDTLLFLEKNRLQKKTN